MGDFARFCVGRMAFCIRGIHETGNLETGRTSRRRPGSAVSCHRDPEGITNQAASSLLSFL